MHEIPFPRDDGDEARTADDRPPHDSADSTATGYPPVIAEFLR
ncbi:hypothetical protein [Halomarina pelagica]|nr:hypothetical protein [Halomarina sp. BND7]